MALAIASSILLSSGACRPASVAPCAAGSVCVDATVRHFDLEGGFWAFRGDDSVTYDPAGGVPSDFQRDGLRVYLVAKERPDMASIHMVGRVVDIVSIQKR
jgi:hypothetical protein